MISSRALQLRMLTLVLMMCLVAALAGCGGGGQPASDQAAISPAAANPYAGTYCGTMNGTRFGAFVLQIGADGSVRLTWMGPGSNGLWFGKGTTNAAGTTQWSVCAAKADPKPVTFSAQGAFSGVAGARVASGVWTSTEGGSGTWMARLTGNIANVGTWPVSSPGGGPTSFSYTRAAGMFLGSGPVAKQMLCLLFDTSATVYPAEAFVVVPNPRSVALGKAVGGSMGMRFSTLLSGLYFDNNADGMPWPQITLTAKNLKLGGLNSGKVSGTLYCHQGLTVKTITLSKAAFTKVKIVAVQ